LYSLLCFLLLINLCRGANLASFIKKNCSCLNQQVEAFFFKQNQQVQANTVIRFCTGAVYAVWFLACHSEFSNAAWLQLSDFRLGFGSSFSSFVLYIISSTCWNMPAASLINRARQVQEFRCSSRRWFESVLWTPTRKGIFVS
jgi:hypothetical protein